MSITSKKALKTIFPDWEFFVDNGNIFVKDLEEADIRNQLKDYKVSSVPEYIADTRYKRRIYKQADIYQIGNRFYMLKKGTRGCYFFGL